MNIVKKQKREYTLPSSWMGLLAELYPLYPIRNQSDYKKAIAAADLLVGRELTATQLKYLDSLTVLIENYESKHFDICASMSPAEVISYLCEVNNLTASDLGRIIGDRSLGSRILKGQRQLSKAHISRLSEYFSAEPGLFF